MHKRICLMICFRTILDLQTDKTDQKSVITHSPPVTQKRATPLPEWGLPTLCINGTSHLNKKLDFTSGGLGEPCLRDKLGHAPCDRQIDKIGAAVKIPFHFFWVQVQFPKTHRTDGRK